MLSTNLMVYNMPYKEGIIMHIAKSIKTLRKEMGLTQDEFASRLKMHGRQLARYETGKANPSVEILKKIADYCEVSIDFLVYGHDKKLANRSKINDMQILDMFRRVNKLKKSERDKVKWAIGSLLD